MSVLQEENEKLRAQFGAMGLPIDRSLEGDTLDMHLQIATLENENQSLKRGLEQYEQGMGFVITSEVSAYSANNPLPYQEMTIVPKNMNINIPLYY